MHCISELVEHFYDGYFEFMSGNFCVSISLRSVMEFNLVPLLGSYLLVFLLSLTFCVSVCLYIRKNCHLSHDLCLVFYRRPSPVNPAKSPVGFSKLHTIQASVFLISNPQVYKVCQVVSALRDKQDGKQPLRQHLGKLRYRCLVQLFPPLGKAGNWSFPPVHMVLCWGGDYGERMSLIFLPVST